MRRLPFAAARAAALAAWALVFAALVPAALGLSLQTDAEALCALLSGARPTARAALSSWDCSNSSSTAANPLCTGATPWAGVTCDAAPRVVSISFNFPTLGGYQALGSTIPASIGQLDQLTRLDLAYASLTSTIPSTVGLLTRLRNLTLIGNSLTGVIPASAVGLMTDMIYLDFGTNRFKSELNMTALCSLHKMQMINTAKAQLSGSLPSCIGNWRGMTVMSMWINSFYGSIPSELGLLTAMSSLFLDINQFTGSIPSEIARLTKLKALDAYSNKLRGEVPDLSPMRKTLYRLSLQNNALTGPALPAWLMTLTELKVCELYGNPWTKSTIPAAIANLKLLALLRLGESQLTGSIPTEVCLATSLLLLNLTQNSLTGPIPPCIGVGPSQLQYLKLRSNHLTGAIPPSLVNLSSLAVFDASFNSLSGDLPSMMQSLKSLALLNLGHNKLGPAPLPLALGSMKRLQFLYLNENEFASTIPASLFCGLGRLLVLSLARNSLSGSLSSCIGALSAVQSIDLSFNQLGSSLPGGDALAGLSACRALKLSNNKFSAAVPSALSRLSSLVTLQLDHNLFTNKISLFIDPAVQTRLASVDVSSNAFTGPVGGGDAAGAGSVFLLPSLQSFASSSNCFEGSLPSSLCSATLLQSLHLNGLTSGNGCKRSLWPQPNAFSFTGSYASQAVLGELPRCLFRSLPNITTLHLLGNGLRGKLPDDGLGWPPMLQELTLSQNRLSGSLSPALQRDLQRLSSVDFGFNEIDGVLSDVVLPAEVFRAEVNRLSGILSSSIISGGGKSSFSLSVLDSNLFDCSSTRGADLPAADPYLSRFQCGSMALNKYFYALLALLLGSALLAAAPMAIKRWRQSRGGDDVGVAEVGGEPPPPPPPPQPQPQQQPQQQPATKSLPGILDFNKDLVLRALGRLPPWDWRPHCRSLHDSSRSRSSSSSQSEQQHHPYAQDDDSSDAAFPMLARVLARTRMLSSALVLLAAVALSPLYAVLTATSSTHTFSYAWTLSAAFKSGDGAAAALLVFWTLFLVVNRQMVKTAFYSCRLKKHRRESLRSSESGGLGGIGDISDGGMKARLAARLVVVSVVNGVAVLAGNVLYVKYNTTGTNSEQAVLKICFSLYKFIWNTTVLNWLVKNPALFFGVPRVLIEVSGGWLRGGELFVLGLLTFNNIVAPCMAQAVTDARCFEQAFYAVPPVSATYTVSTIAAGGITFFDYRKASGLYLPNVSFPIIQSEEQLVTQSSSFSAPFLYRYGCSSSLLQSYVPVFVLLGVLSIFGTPIKYVLIRAVVEALFGPVAVPPTTPTTPTSPDSEAAAGGSTAQTRPLHQLHRALLSALPYLLWTEEEKQRHPNTNTRPVDLERFHLETLGDMCVVLTFGLASPLLVLVLAGSMLARVWRMEHLLASCLPLAGSCSREAHDVAATLRHHNAFDQTSSFLLAFPAVFLALFLVDMSCDAAGLSAGVWAPATMLALPAAVATILHMALPASGRKAVARAAAWLLHTAHWLGGGASVGDGELTDAELHRTSTAAPRSVKFISAAISLKLSSRPPSRDSGIEIGSTQGTATAAAEPVDAIPDWDLQDQASEQDERLPAASRQWNETGGQPQLGARPGGAGGGESARRLRPSSVPTMFNPMVDRSSWDRGTN